MAKNHSKYYVVAVLPLFGVENGRPDTWKGFLHCQILQIKVYRKIHEECILTYRVFFFYCVSPLRKSQNYYNTFFSCTLNFWDGVVEGTVQALFLSLTFIFMFTCSGCEYQCLTNFMLRNLENRKQIVVEKQETFQDDPEWAQQRGWLRAIVRSIWPAVVSDTSLLRLLPGKL